MTDATASSTIFHGSCVSWNRNAVLLTGRSGSGKSSLALHLMAMGCDLIADDRTLVTRARDHLDVTCPEAISGQIEARGIGILPAVARSRAMLSCIVDLEKVQHARLPARETTQVLGLDVPFFRKPATEAFPFAILQYLKSQKLDPL